MKDNVVINLSTHKYLKGQKRLQMTLAGYSNSDFLFYTDENQFASPKHIDNPYAFKTYAIKNALDKGYKKILWLDASIYAIKDISPAWNIIENEGYLMQEAGWFCGQWANDKCLEYFNITRDEAMTMPMYGNAGLLGLNFENETAINFFELWHKSSQDGIFKGSWNNNNKTESNDTRCLGHRHDMVAGSIIANKLKMRYIPSNQIMQYGCAPHIKPINDTIILKAYGIS